LKQASELKLESKPQEYRQTTVNCSSQYGKSGWEPARRRQLLSERS